MFEIEKSYEEKYFPELSTELSSSKISITIGSYFFSFDFFESVLFFDFITPIITFKDVKIEGLKYFSLFYIYSNNDYVFKRVIEIYTKHLKIEKSISVYIPVEYIIFPYSFGPHKIEF
ncbi:MAG: hypothetical protein RMJ67_01350 [Elusimicrobiota bacterium]|nr:hypothetical protein [Endomicrobiia bacterium]MDW8165150.1 hypothetical protein [Elusimicrobiota bacterium]